MHQISMRERVIIRKTSLMSVSVMMISFNNCLKVMSLLTNYPYCLKESEMNTLRGLQDIGLIKMMNHISQVKLVIVK